MCGCAKPNKNVQPGYSWDGRQVSTHPVDRPKLLNGDTVLFDEPGRCCPLVKGAGGTDYHSHHLTLVKNSGEFILLIRHGAGDERISLGYSYTKVGDLISLLPDSDTRYLMLYAMYRTHTDATRDAEEKERTYWRKAAAEKRIKTRKMPGRAAVKVWVEGVPSSEVAP